MGPAKDALLEMLVKHGIYGVHVEIVNRDLTFNPSLFPLAPEDKAVLAFENCKLRLVNILNQKLLNQWRVLCPFNVGSKFAAPRPALVVLVDPLAFANWHDVSIDLKTELSSSL